MTSSYLEELHIDTSDGTAGATPLYYLHFGSIPASLNVAPPSSCHSSLAASWLVVPPQSHREVHHYSSAYPLWVL